MTKNLVGSLGVLILSYYWQIILSPKQRSLVKASNNKIKSEKSTQLNSLINK